MTQSAFPVFRFHQGIQQTKAITYLHVNEGMHMKLLLSQEHL